MKKKLRAEEHVAQEPCQDHDHCFEHPSNVPCSIIKRPVQNDTRLQNDEIEIEPHVVSLVAYVTECHRKI